MPEVKYKFKADPTFSVFQFEDLSVSAARLRQEVINQKLKGNAGAVGLMLTNSKTGQGKHEMHCSEEKGLTLLCYLAEYVADDAAIPDGTSILVKRVPLSRLSGGADSSVLATSHA